MNETIKNDILSILKKATELLKTHDYGGLNELSNHTIHDASVFQDEDSISVAILVYALSKIMQREKHPEQLLSKILGKIKEAQILLEQEKLGKYSWTIKQIFSMISEEDKALKLYIQEVINQAEINKGSKLYEHGISIARASKMMNVSRWELMSYVGKTSLTEEPVNIENIRSRLTFARELFNLRR